MCRGSITPLVLLASAALGLPAAEESGASGGTLGGGAKGSVVKVDTCQRYAEGVLRVMTFNLQTTTATPRPAPWAIRERLIADLVRRGNYHLIGVQEALPQMMEGIAQRLPGYRYLGQGRDGGRTGEYSGIFYRSDRLQVLASSTFWLSPTPAKAGSIGWDAAYPRIATWGAFVDRRLGREFLAINTHLDRAGLVARARGLRLVLDQARRLSGGLPTVLLGDYNFTSDSSLYSLATASGRYRDAMSLTVPLGPRWTYPARGTRLAAAHDKKAAEIDYVFVSGDALICRHEVIAHQQRAARCAPSDHLPVAVSLLWQ